MHLLTKARRDAKLRQVDLAGRLSWQQAYVSRYETGERLLGVDEYVAVALAIGVDPVLLLKQALEISVGKRVDERPTE
ncbi:MAG: helix-turn-helix transcriptional regulator [Sphingomonas sp.]|uniref:helix-turn-helix domain-containing protein n=1 Tax=Sphingomonas TaxID=13687 RepID=UPI000687CD85|nr:MULTISPECIES: helix-turn-helix transcriptional regulator [Sphingomonas]MCP4028008.1 helix-turn-helix transcriptional regulator [Sphingomonas sp.]